ncbi:MAG: GntR family transcriptional regulator [Candidatus Cloacimonetes bacterium]|nr:GntR family transcriptional regulator [Candidatus Cloacimonadota bacterium]
MKFNEAIPIYLQIKEEIENAIIADSLKENEAIPSIRSCSQQYRLNPQTISNAINELMNEGVIYKKRGIGMFVGKGAQKKLKQKKSKEFRNTDLKKVIMKSRSLGITKTELKKILDAIYEEGGKK